MRSSGNSRIAERRKYDLDYFAKEYWKEDLPGQSGETGLSYDDEDHSTRFRFLGMVISSLIIGPTILDAGCGPALLARFGKLGRRRILSVDFSLSAISLSERQGDEAVGRIERLPFSDDVVETTVCIDVLEHVLPNDLLCAARELLRVTRSRLILSINMDNPYHYHPSIFPRSYWSEVFVSLGLQERTDLEAVIQAQSFAVRPEYQWFIFDSSLESTRE